MKPKNFPYASVLSSDSEMPNLVGVGSDPQASGESAEIVLHMFFVHGRN